MRIIHAADIHLDSPLKGLQALPGTAHEEVRLATRRAFVRLIDLCLEEQAALLLIAGDLFDQEQKDLQAGLFAARQFARLRETNTAVVMVRGNHDAATLTKTLRDQKNVSVTVLNHTRPESRDFPDLGVVVHGQSFAETHVRDNLARTLPARRDDFFNIGLLHADVGGSADAPYAYSPCTRLDLMDKGYDYWALGHNHVREELCTNPYIVYPGNLQGRHIQETGVKGCTLLHIENHSIVQVTARSCDTVRWEHLHLDVTDCCTVDQVIDMAFHALGKLRASCQPPDHPLVVRITVHGETVAHPLLFEDMTGIQDEISAKAAEWHIWPERIKIATNPPPATRATLPSAFITELEREFTRLGENADELQRLLGEVTPLDQLALTYRLAPNPTEVEHAETLLRASAHFVLARLRGNSHPSS